MDSTVARRIAREMALVLSRKLGPHVFHGDTMRPFLVDGDAIEIEPVAFDDIRAGDIVTYRDQEYFPTRRVVRVDRKSRSLILKGDAIPELVFFVLEEDVLGRAVAYVRGGRRSTAAESAWSETADAIVLRERRRARKARISGWLGLGGSTERAEDEPEDETAAAAPVPGAAREPWWRTGRAAVDLDALQVVLALLAGEQQRALSMFSRLSRAGMRRFLDFTRENGIAADLVLFARDTGGGSVSAVFDPILGELIEAARIQREANQRVVRTLADVTSVVDRAGIASILLKGPHLSLSYYGSLERRRMGDLDLLVRRGDMRAAHRALVEAGWQPRSATPLGMSGTLRFVHHLELEKDGTPVDLHHQLRVHPTFRFDDTALWETAGRLDVAGTRVRVLADEYVLVTVILSIHTDIALGTADLHHLFDLERILARIGEDFDWEAFFAARRREGTETIAVNVLALYRVVMGVEERHPRMLDALRRRAGQFVRRPDRRAFFELVRGGSLAVKKRWALAQLSTSLPAAALWWLAALPVHALVYRRIFLRNFGERLALGRKPRERRSRRRARRPGAPPPRTAVPAAVAAIGSDSDVVPALSVRPMRLGSLAIELHHDRPFAADVLEELFRLEGTRRDAAGISAPDLRVRVFDTTTEDLHRLVPPPFAPVVRRDLEGIVEIHHKAASALLVHPRGSGPAEVVVPIRPTTCGADPGERVPVDEPTLVHSLMIVFYRALLELGCLHLHAAAVRTNGSASLFLGEKGAGKSTLCLALGRTGATILGEDHVLVRRTAAGFTVSGCDANMRLTSQTEAALMAAPPEGRHAYFGGVLKREFDLRETRLDVQPFIDVRPTRLFFPHVGRRVAVAPLSRAEAVVRILRSIHDRHAIATSSDARRLLDYVAGLAGALEVYDLELSPDLAELGGLTARLSGDAALA